MTKWPTSYIGRQRIEDYEEHCCAVNAFQPHTHINFIPGAKETGQKLIAALSPGAHLFWFQRTMTAILKGTSTYASIDFSEHWWWGSDRLVLVYQ